MAGSGENPGERSPEERERAAAERAARRAARGGRPAPGGDGRPGGAGGPPSPPRRRRPPQPGSRGAASGESGPGAADGREVPGDSTRSDGERPTAPASGPGSLSPQHGPSAGSPDSQLGIDAGSPDPEHGPGAGSPGPQHRPDAGAAGPHPEGSQSDSGSADDEPTERYAAEEEEEEAVARSVPRAAGARPAAASGKRRGRGRGRREKAGLAPVAGSEPSGRTRTRRWGGRLLALAAIAAIGAALYLINATFQPFHGDGGRAVRVQIPEGANVARIGDLLEQRGVVASGDFFNVNVTLTGRRAKLRPGDYTLRRGMSYGDASEALMQGPEVRVVETFDVTIPEGLARTEIAERLEDTPVRGDYLKATELRRFRSQARRLGLPSGRKTLEGYLFPATYELETRARARDLVRKQLDAFEANFKRVDLARAKRRNLSRYDVVTIASMIERETAVASERRLVSAVIHNRLRQDMPLGIDATIRYATDNWTRPIRVSELEEDGPYNSRLRTGLPPTPIGNPGLASLKAAANPANVDYIYYVVKPGTCGEHAFSSTSAEFERDSARYNEARAERGGQSPTDC